MAWFKRHPSKMAGLMFQSDRGSQCASNDFRGVLNEYGIRASMSRRGGCWDKQTRLHSTLASASPMPFEQDWLAEQPRQVNS